MNIEGVAPEIKAELIQRLETIEVFEKDIRKEVRQLQAEVVRVLRFIKLEAK